MVQQMIISAFSALGLQGKGDLPSSFWLVDSGASNHMTSSSDALSNVCTYHGATNIFRLLMVLSYLFMLLGTSILLLKMSLYLLSFLIVSFQ